MGLDASIEKLLREEIAAKVVMALTEHQKNEILAIGITKILNDLEIKWQVHDLLVKEAFKYAREYVSQPEIQEKIKERAIHSVNLVFDGLIKAFTKEMESFLKSKYTKIFEDS